MFKPESAPDRRWSDQIRRAWGSQSAENEWSLGRYLASSSSLRGSRMLIGKELASGSDIGQTRAA